MKKLSNGAMSHSVNWRFQKVSGALVCGFANVLAISIPTAARAQVIDQDLSSDQGLQEIIVTAQRRGQNLQDVPLSVAAYNGETLTNAGINKVQDVAQIDASLNIPASTGVVTPFLRGVGNPGATLLGNEASVPVYIDDVYYTRLSPAYLELANIERLEVLKGPQGTLFGRNATGGLLQVFTRDPDLNNIKLDMTGGYGNYDTVSGKFYASAPLSDSLAIDLAVNALKQNGGWGRNLITGKPTGTNKFINLRSKLLFEPSSSTRIKLIGYSIRSKTQQGVFSTNFTNTISATPPFPPYGPIQNIAPPENIYDSNYTFNPYLRHKAYGGSLKIEQDLGPIDLVSISAYRHAREFYLSEGDATPFNFLRYELNSIDRQISQELQLKSHKNSTFDWILGAYYLDSKQGFDPTLATGDAITASGGPGASLGIFGLQRIKSTSGYGQATFHVLPEGTNVTMGLRYTVDKVRGTGRQDFAIPGAGVFPGQTPYDDKFTFNKLTYKVAVDHKFSDDVMGYVSISRGYKSGTFNTLPLSTDPAKPEVVDSYEAGMKTEFFDRRLRANVAIFQNNTKNPQVQTVIANGNTAFIGLTNAKSAKVRGIEVALDAVVADGLQLRASGAYLDAKYTSFANAPFNYRVSDLPQNGGTCPGLNVGDPLVPAATGGFCPVVVRNASGNRLAQVPQWKLNVGASYSLNTTTAGTFMFDTNLAYTGRFTWDADNFVQNKPYVLVNGSLTYELPDNDRWSIRIWGKNLTKTHFFTISIPAAGGSGNIAAPGAPRTYGFEVRYRL